MIKAVMLTVGLKARSLTFSIGKCLVRLEDWKAVFAHRNLTEIKGKLKTVEHRTPNVVLMLHDVNWIASVVFINFKHHNAL